ncbi:MAG: radical SAM protein [Gammaproteobacteria bacterium]|nr:radical SAM protein [Gammaproteobacteria bacterium]
MDLTIIPTFRCNSRCQMCYIWKSPTEPKEEVRLATLEKLPDGFDNVNVSGGEPTLRKDLPEIIDLIYPKGRIIEISSNGLRPEKLIAIIKKYPDIKVRFSLEGDEAMNNRIRGEKNGFAIKTEGLRKLKEAGGTDLGFALVIQDENVEQLVDIYEFAQKEGFELATSTLHNAWQFYKNDNYFYNRTQVAKQVEGLVVSMLKTNNVKNWFRAYLNLGLIEKILGHDRLIKCTAGSDFAFVDPWSDVWACNVRTDLPLGNLERQNWSDIMSGSQYDDITGKVSNCKQNCWMVTTARTAMRSSLSPKLPKLVPLLWVLKNKIKTTLGLDICVEQYIDYDNVSDSPVVERINFLDHKEKGKLERGRDTVKKRYPLKEFENT